MRHIIDEVIKYIKHNYSPTMKVQDISEHFGYSKYHFSREFKKIKGFSIQSYLSSLKIENGLHLLAEQNTSLINAQLKSGFLSTGTFSSTFKDYTGLPPKQYIRNINEDFNTLKAIEEHESVDEVGYEQAKTPFENSCFVTFSYPKHIDLSVIFVGFFRTPIPNHKPIVGKAIFSKKKCVLKNIPTGKYYLLACAIEKSQNPLDYFKLDLCYRGMVDEVAMFPQNNGVHFHIDLREPIESDPPILVNLPNLLKSAKNSNV